LLTKNLFNVKGKCKCKSDANIEKQLGVNVNHMLILMLTKNPFNVNKYCWETILRM